MNNDITNTGNVSNTANPQGNAPAPGASNSEDFQSTANQDALNTQTDELTVQETGDPITETGAVEASDGLSMGWMILIGLSILVVIVVAVKAIKEVIDEDRADSKTTARKTPAKKAAVPAKKTTTKKPARNTTRSGKKKTASKSKKRR